VRRRLSRWRWRRRQQRTWTQRGAPRRRRLRRWRGSWRRWKRRRRRCARPMRRRRSVPLTRPQRLQRGLPSPTRGKPPPPTSEAASPSRCTVQAASREATTPCLAARRTHSSWCSSTIRSPRGTRHTAASSPQRAALSPCSVAPRARSLCRAALLRSSAAQAGAARRRRCDGGPPSVVLPRAARACGESVRRERAARACGESVRRERAARAGVVVLVAVVNALRTRGRAQDGDEERHARANLERGLRLWRGATPIALAVAPAHARTAPQSSSTPPHCPPPHSNPSLVRGNVWQMSGS
jgi:hypothetical protein